MAFVVNDRVKETTTSTGTGTVNLGGAATGFETFVAGIGNSNTTYYCIQDQGGSNFEIGLGTVTDATPDTLSRTTVLSSSNSDSLVNFGAGTKDVFCTLPASKAVVEDGSNNVAIGNNITVGGTVDGIDIATRDGVLTSTTTTANAALPKAGGAMTGAITSASDFTVDAVGAIILDGDDEGTINFKDGGTRYGLVKKASDNFEIQSMISDGDLVIKGNDGGSTITALSLDMSEGGNATFNSNVTVSDNLTVNDDLTVDTDTLVVTSGTDNVEINGYLTVNGTGVDVNTIIYPNGISMADSATISFGTAATFQLSGGADILSLQVAATDDRFQIRQGTDK